MARKKKQQEQRVKTFSELEAERRQQERGREAGGSRPASMSFSEMEQYRRNQQDKAIISYVKDRYRDTADPEAARQVIRTRAARNEAESMLDSYAKGYQQFGTNLRRKANGWQPNAAGTAESAKAETKRALERAGEIRSYLRNNRETLGNKTGEYEAYLDQYVRNYGADARDAAAWARDVESAGSEKEYEKETALKAGDMKAVVWENLLREAEQGKTDEQGITSGIQRAAEAWRGAKAQGDEASAAEAWKNLQEQYAKRNTLTQRAKELSTLTGVSGGYEEQIAEIKKRIAENKEETGKYFEDEIEKLEKEYAKLAAYSGQYETEEIKKRKEEIEERLSEIGYYDTRKKSFWETALWTGVSGITSWANALAGAPDRIMETFFPGYDDPDYTGRDSDAINPFDFKAVNAATKWLANYSETRRQLSLKNKSEFSRFLSDSLQSLTPMAADMLIAYLTGGASLASEGGGLIKETTQGYQMLTNMANSPYFYSTALQEFSGKFDEEVEKGVDPTTAGLAATLNGVLNAAIEIGFGIEDIAGVQELPSEIAEKMAGKADRTKVQLLVDWVKDAVSEGNEEVAQKFVGDILSRIAESPTATDVPANVLNTYSNGAEDWAEYGKAWGGGALVGGLMGPARAGITRVGETAGAAWQGLRKGGVRGAINSVQNVGTQYTAKDERITRYLEEIAREKGDTSSASLRSAPSPQGEGAGTSPRETEEVQAPQTAQEAAETQRTVPEGMTEEEAERAAMTPEEREAADREAREAERDLRELVEESEASAKDRSDETEEKTGPFGVSGTGRIETGKDATIAGVERVQNGEMIYRLSDGSTVNAADVKYANRGEALVSEAVAGIGVDRRGAEILLREWAPAETKVSGEDYAAGMTVAYNYGLRRYSAEEVAANRDLAVLTENQIRAAYELGRIESDESAKRSDARLRSVTPAEARGSRGGVRIEGGVKVEGETQQAQVKALDAIGRAVGVRIVVYDGGTGEAGQPGVNGFYDARDRSIHINLRAGASGDGIMLNTAAHELTHYIHDTARTEYNKLADFLFSQYGKAGVTLSSMIAEEKQAALDAGRQISDEEAMMEVVADSMETMLSDGVVIETLTRENRSLAQRIAGKIGDLVRKIRSIGRAAGAETIEGRIVEDAVREGEKLREMWTQALRKAAEVGTAAEAESDQEYVSYSVRRARAADRVTLLSEATIEDATDQETIEAISQFQIREAELQAAEGEMRATKHEIAALVAAGKDQNSDRIAELNEKLYLQTRAVEEGRHNLRKKANSKEMRAIAEKVLQRRIAETEALEEAVPKEENRTRTISAIEEKAKEIAALRKSNEMLERKLEAAKEELTVRDSRSFRRDDLDKLARSLLREYQNSTMDPNEVREELEKIGQMLIDGDTVEIKAHLSDAIRPLAEAIIGDARESIDVNKDTREKLAEWMRAGIRIPKNNVNDLDPAFRRRNAWWIRVNNGESVDVVYEELATQFGEGLFPPDVINPADMAERIAEIYEAMKPIEQNPHEGIENAMIESVIQDVVDGMLSESMRLQPQTARERYEAKIEETERALSETKKQLREERNARRKEQRRTAEELLRDKGEKILARMEQSAWMTDMVDRIQKRNDRITTMRRIISTAKTLERDLTGQTKNRVVEKFRKPVAELVAALDINMPAYDAAVRRVTNLEKRIAAAEENAGYRARLEQDLAEAKKKRDFLERKHAAVYEILKRELGTGDVKEELRKYAERGIQDPLGKFVTAYGNTRNTPGEEEIFDEDAYQRARTALEDIGEGQTLAKLSVENLKALEDLLTVVRHRVRHGAEVFLEGKEIDWMVESTKVMREVGEIGRKRERQSRRNPGGLAEKTEKFLVWANLKMADAMERIGSPELVRIWKDLRAGELQAATGAEEAKNFAAAMREKYNAKKWDVKSAREFQAKHGKTVSLTLPQMMALYAYSKRGDAATIHLSQGGFILRDAIRTVTETDEKTGKKRRTYQVRDGAAYAMGTDEIAKVVGELTKEQTDYVDAMLKYLSEVMGAKGNAVSLKLNGLRQFQEKNYFPLMVAQAFIDTLLDKNAGEQKIRSFGWTHSLVPNANSTVVLEGFDDVWARHVSEMEMYCAFTLPMETFTKIYNYRTYAGEEDTGDSVKAQLGRVWGNNATEYIEQMLKDVNGQPTQKGFGLGDKMLRTFKVAATAASLSTIVQQPTSVWRAMAYIDPKYFLPQRIALGSVNRLYNEMKEYAPVAVLKDMGRFDTGTGRTLREYIQDNQKWTEKTLEVFGKGAELADRYTWVQIWQAAKRKAAAERKKPTRGFSPRKILRYTGDISEVQAAKKELLKRAGQIADEAILRTQVYDSVFTRSQNMRKKDTFSKMATAFMAEPTTTMNQFISGIWDLGSGQKARGARKMATAFVSAIAAAVASSVVYAMRDKDDDKTYAEKLIKHGVGEILDEMNPMTYFPYIRDINSLLQGYSVERADMTQISNLISAFNKASKGGENAGHNWGLALGELANFSGVPLKNLQRDFYGIYRTVQQTVSQIGGGESIIPSWDDVGRMALTGFREAQWTTIRNKMAEPDKKDKLLYNAWQSGNESAKRKWTRQYKDEETAEKAVIKLLAAEDERIGEAAQARLSGDATRYGEIIQKIAAEGKFTEAMIAEAERSYERKISSAASDAKKAYLDEDFGALAVARDELYALAGEKLAEEKLEEVIEKANEEEDKEFIVPRESIYTASDVAGALDNSGAEAANEILADLIEAAGGEENAANVRRTAKSAITSRMKPKFQAAAESGNRELMEEIIQKLTASGLYGARGEAEKTVEKWIG